MPALPCAVEGCKQPAVTREIYLNPGGRGKFADEVCSWHTGRHDRLQMIGKEPVPGQVECQTVKE